MSKELEIVKKLQHCGVEEYRIALEKVEQIILEYDYIKNANPSEALEKLLDRANHDEYLSRIGTEEAIKFLNENQLFVDTIKQALLKALENEKVLEIIFEKNVDILELRVLIEDHNDKDALSLYNSEHGIILQLTQEEFNLLKEVLKK